MKSHGNTGDDYASQMGRLHDAIKAKHPQLLKRKCSFTRITHLHINLQLLLQKYMTYFRYIRLILVLAITLSFQTRKNGSLDENSLQVTRSEQQQPIIHL